MKEIILASHNQGKISELSRMLQPFGIKVISSNDITLPNVEETGQTFEENAALKAETIAKITNLPTLADDSGLCVDALNGEPGVYTARYGGVDKLLANLEKTPLNERTARFVCVLALKVPKNDTIFFTGTVEGTITKEKMVNKGFAFDPIFIPKGDNRTYAQMTAEEKAKTSHRKIALEQFLSYIK